MAKAKKDKEYWYVIVMTDDGPKFVTGTGDHNMAYWEKDEAPEELGEFWAKDIAKGLLLNCYSAFPVCSPIELSHQPYDYKRWHIEWKENESEVE